MRFDFKVSLKASSFQGFRNVLGEILLVQVDLDAEDPEAGQGLYFLFLEAGRVGPSQLTYFKSEYCKKKPILSLRTSILPLKPKG